jgi:hypothetical protein
MADASNLGTTASSRLFVYLSRHWLLAWTLLAMSFLLFGLLSVNLLHVLSANLNFLAEHGIDAVRDGGLLQLAEIVLTVYVAVACYVVFKFCERILVDRLAHTSKQESAS